MYGSHTNIPVPIRSFQNGPVRSLGCPDHDLQVRKNPSLYSTSDGPVIDLIHGDRSKIYKIPLNHFDL